MEIGPISAKGTGDSYFSQSVPNNVLRYSAAAADRKHHTPPRPRAPLCCDFTSGRLLCWSLSQPCLAPREILTTHGLYLRRLHPGHVGEAGGRVSHAGHHKQQVAKAVQINDHRRAVCNVGLVG